MTALFGGDPVSFNGTTAVTAVGAPASSRQREVYSMLVNNLDNVSHDFIVQLNANGTIHPLPPVTVSAGDVGQLIFSGAIVLDATTDTCEVKLGEAMSSVQPKAFPAYLEVP